MGAFDAMLIIPKTRLIRKQDIAGNDHGETLCTLCTAEVLGKSHRNNIANLIYRFFNYPVYARGDVQEY